jgi:pimeloyl-ACP methyl ester carboxylesterase
MDVREYGDPKGETLLFVHGAGLNGGEWSRIAEDLADFHCLCPDLPGHGANRAATFSIDGSVGQLAAIAEEYGRGKKVNVVGHSLGGAVVLTFLGRHADLVNKTIITGSSGELKRWMVELSMPLFGILKLFSDEKLVRMTFSQHRIPMEYYDLFHDLARSNDAGFLKTIYTELVGFRMPESISCPLLVCAGEKESGAAKAYGQISLRPFHRYETAEGVLMPDGSHAWPLQYPRIFAEMTRSWIRGGELPRELIRLTKREPASGEKPRRAAAS